MQAEVVDKSPSEDRTALGATRPAVLLDRDGTIIEDRGYVGSIERVRLIEGAAEAIRDLNQAQIPVVVVTNQAGVARGFYEIRDVERVHDYLSAILRFRRAHVDLFLYCPYHPDGTIPAFSRSSHDRKPEPGMAYAAARALNLDLAASWVVGDRPEDIGLARSIGARAIYLTRQKWYGPNTYTAPNLAAAVRLILRGKLC